MTRSVWLLAATLSACTPFDQLASPEGYAIPTDEVAFPGARVDGEGEIELEAADGGVYVVPYVIQAGMAVAGEDMILGTADEVTEQLRAAGIGRASRLWSTCTIPYALDASLTAAARNDFLQAVMHWEENTTLRFVENASATNRIRVVGGSGCSSYVGYRGGVQDLTLAANCGRGAAIHEIGHAMGLWHEQSRSDADDHVAKHMHNVQAGKEHNFRTYQERGQPGIDLGAYDKGSIMHYGSWSFSTGTCTVSNPSGCTITNLDGSYLTQVQRLRLSDGDLAGIEAMYGDQCGVVVHDDHGDDLESATPIGTGSVDGNLTPGDEDFFRVTVTPGHTVTLYSTGTIDTFGHLLDATGAELARNDDGGAGRNFHLEFVATAPVVWLRVRGYSASTAGDYQVHVESAPPPDDHGNTDADATPLALDPADPLLTLDAILDPGDRDVFRITVPFDGVLSAATTGSVDTYGTLRDADGAVLDQNDDTQGRNFAVSAAVPAGDYFLEVRGYAASTQGPYTLQIGLLPE